MPSRNRSNRRKKSKKGQSTEAWSWKSQGLSLGIKSDDETQVVYPGKSAGGGFNRKDFRGGVRFKVK